jgi:two-component sensor histidine kinase
MFGVRPIGLETRFADFEAPSDEAVAVGLVVNELLTNAAKYAFGGVPGMIRVSVDHDGNGGVEIMVADDGCGFNPEAASAGLGDRLVRSLVGQLGGDFSIQSGDGGTLARVRYATARPGPA